MVARSLPKAPCCSTSRPVSADWLTWLALLAVLVRRRRRSAAEGEIVSFTYNFPKPGAKAPAPKETLEVRIGKQACDVSYFKA